MATPGRLFHAHGRARVPILLFSKQGYLILEPLVRLYKVDPNGLVTLMKKISRLEKCDPKPTHFFPAAAKGGG